MYVQFIIVIIVIVIMIIIAILSHPIHRYKQFILPPLPKSRPLVDNIDVHLDNLLDMITEFSVARSTVESIVAVPGALTKLLQSLHIFPRRKELVNGVCNVIRALLFHLQDDGSLVSSAVVRGAVVEHVVGPIFDLVGQLLTGTCPSEARFGVSVVIDEEIDDDDDDDDDKDEGAKGSAKGSAKPKGGAGAAAEPGPFVMPVSGLYVPYGMHAGRMAFYQPFKPVIVNQSDKSMEEHLRSPYYLFWDEAGGRWVISAQLGNAAAYVAFVKDDVRHPGCAATLWVVPRKDVTRGQMCDFFCPNMSVRPCVGNGNVSLSSYLWRLCEIVEECCFSSAAAAVMVESPSLPAVIKRIGVILTAEYNDPPAPSQGKAVRYLTDYAIDMINAALGHLTHRASMRSYLASKGTGASIADELVSAFMSASSKPVLMADRPKTTADIDEDFPLVGLLELNVKWDEPEVLLPIDIADRLFRLEAIAGLLDIPILLCNEAGPVADALRVRFQLEVTPRLLDLALQAALRGGKWMSDTINLPKLIAQLARLCEVLSSAHAIAMRPKALARFIAVLHKNTSTAMDRMTSESKLTQDETSSWHEKACLELLRLWAAICGHLRVDADIKNAKAEMAGSEQVDAHQKDLEEALFNTDPVPVMVHILEVRSSMEYQELATQCLMRLAESHEEHREAIARYKGIDALLQIIKTGNVASQCRAALALSSVLRNSVERLNIFVSIKGVQPIVRLLTSTENELLQMSLQMVALQISSLSDSAMALFLAGGIPVLVNLLKKPALPTDHAARIVTILLRLSYLSNLREPLQQSGVVDAVNSLLASAGPTKVLSETEENIVESSSDNINTGQPLTDDFDETTERLQEALAREQRTKDRNELALLDRPSFHAFSMHDQGPQLMAQLQPKAPTGPALDPALRHVMLSYNWTYQSTFLRIRDALQAKGLKVWMDVEKMKVNGMQY